MPRSESQGRGTTTAARSVAAVVGLGAEEGSRRGEAAPRRSLVLLAMAHPQMARARKNTIARPVNSFSAKESPAGAPAVRSTVPEPPPDSGTRRAGFPDLRIGQERSTDTPPILALAREETCACSTPEVIPPRAGAGGRPVSTAPAARDLPSPAVCASRTCSLPSGGRTSDAAWTESRPRFGSNGRMRYGIGLLEARAGAWPQAPLLSTGFPVSAKGRLQPITPALCVASAI